MKEQHLPSGEEQFRAQERQQLPPEKSLDLGLREAHLITGLRNFSSFDFQFYTLDSCITDSNGAADFLSIDINPVHSTLSLVSELQVFQESCLIERKISQPVDVDGIKNVC